MVALVKLVGIVTIVFGAVYFVKPDIMKQMINFWLTGKRLYVGGIINILIGVSFLSAASQCEWKIFIGFIGFLGLVKGIISFVLGPKKGAFLFKKIMERPDTTLRLFAVMILIFGVLIIYAV